jgi:hypothetical protein
MPNKRKPEASKAQEQYFFATPDIIHSWTAKPFVAEGVGRGRWDGEQGTGFCPLHHDRKPSLRFSWMDKRLGTTICCQAGCSFESLAAWVRKKGGWLEPIQTPKRKNGAKTPTQVETSAALAALTKNERRMFDVIKYMENPSYNDFEECGGVHRNTIPDGILVLSGLGLITAFQTRGRLGYGRNAYGLAEQWRDLEPTSARDRKAAVQRAKDAAHFIKHGTERRNKPATPLMRWEASEASGGVPKIVGAGVPKMGAAGVPPRGAENARTSLRVESEFRDKEPTTSKTVDEGERTEEGEFPRARAREAEPDHKTIPFIDKATIVLVCQFDAGDCWLSPEEEERLIGLGLMATGIDKDGCRTAWLTEEGERLVRRRR